MSDTAARFETFSATWLDRLNADSAEVHLQIGPGPKDYLALGREANRFVGECGFKDIGPNWELLDPHAGISEPRSARSAFVEAFAHNMVFTKFEWLGKDAAIACCEDFLACFATGPVSIVTNRMWFGWNPITEATFEWAFVAADESAIALLLATDED
ncbi:hypothetical protein [Erythrobacter sp.]|uniref:hypothetical protein n=1 Tax=Erythrobacter sp. TaxID=1042 RepID=UPI003C74819E